MTLKEAHAAQGTYASSCRKRTFQKQVTALQEEINVLRARAENAENDPYPKTK